MRITIYLCLLLFCSLAATAQDKACQKTIDSLNRTLDAVTIAARQDERKAENLEYLLGAKEMAIRSMNTADTTYQILLAVQAHKFQVDHQGNSYDIDIYQALYNALKRTNDPMTKSLKPSIDRADNRKFTVTTTMANQLCTKVNRNMYLVEWERYANNLAYEPTCLK